MVLQTEKNGLPSTELLQQPGYGICQIVATLSILPVTIYVIRKNLAEFREQAREHLDQLTDDKDKDTTSSSKSERRVNDSAQRNPVSLDLASERRASRRHNGSSSCRDHPGF